MEEIFNVVFTIDGNFIQHFTVTVVSLLENNKDIRFCIYVIHNIEDLSLLDKIKKFINDAYETELKFIEVDDSTFAKYKITHHISKAVYFRLLLADILPNTINKILYLDSDVIVTGSLKELFKVSFDSKYLLAVPDGELDITIPRLNKIGVPVQTYFNSGVMWIDLEAWRLENTSAKLISIANEYMDRILWWDQDILNICFLNKWGQISDKYNALHLQQKCEKIPLIVHYNSPTKPWHYLNYHPYKYLYWHYIKLTPFKKYKYKDFTYKRLFKKIVYKLINKKYKVV